MNNKTLLALIISATALTGCFSEKKEIPKQETIQTEPEPEIVDHSELEPGEGSENKENPPEWSGDEIGIEAESTAPQYTANQSFNKSSIIKQIVNGNELISFSITPVSDNGDTIDIDVQPVFEEHYIQDENGLAFLIKGSLDTFSPKPGTSIYTIKKALILEANTLENVEISLFLKNGEAINGDYHADGDDSFKKIANDFISK